ncbi:molybdopterin-guanine dinucleotide biosynthesis protein [Streptomyces sp. NRRL F-4489]|uniref:NTP transferase domain-containing protein n=1 Tax=Streptomyces sp. NRRL F-4489 TaxID=1609095 RepID=UPI000746A91A|nr:NTP transferase domain-containing protein [Streptomyces sp. NRRL F-4489]KUL35980.1 molybdopterin-guanine dinucleotide biosynthesis protein [Streptomyces sp. NRRL F-4489]
MSEHTDYDAIVLAGGAARRLGGADKPALRVGGRTLLDRVLAACAGAAVTVVVGPARPTARPVVRAREDPPGGGPLAALDAGLRHTTAPTVLLLSADLPFLTPATVRGLLAAAAGPGGPARDGALLCDRDGRDQPLVAAYRSAPLRRALDELRAGHGGLAGLPLRPLLSALDLARVRDAPAAASFDCDTWEDLGTARARIREHGHVLDEWITAVKAELGIDLDVDTAALLDLARDAAHGVARPAAPLTTFLVGYAAARQGGDVAELSRRAAALADRWAAEAAAEEAAAARAAGGGTPGGGTPGGNASGGGASGGEAKSAE